MRHARASLTKALLCRIPGTKANIARKKQLLERQLRQQGYSRSQAVTMAAAKFKKPLPPPSEGPVDVDGV
jgi:hypothetical protein